MPKTKGVNLAPAAAVKSAVPQTLDAAPIFAFMDAITADVATLKRLDPTSGACVSLEGVRSRMQQVIKEASANSLLMSVQQYADREGVSSSAITYRIRTGKLPCRQVGGRYLIESGMPRAA